MMMMMVMMMTLSCCLSAIMHGFGCWFDVEFRGTTAVVVLSTGPGSPGTHW
jgi:type I protein arginine methyltransferase